MGVPVVESIAFMGVLVFNSGAFMGVSVLRVEHSWAFPVFNSGAFMGPGSDCRSHTENPFLDVKRCISNINTAFSTLNRGGEHGPRYLTVKSKQSI